MSSPLTVIYEFDRFRLDRGNQRLTKDGMLLPTPGRTLPILLELIQNREQTVLIQKLVDNHFPRSSFGEEELTSEILKLKRLMDDTSKTAPIIRFVLGQGYHFDAEVTEYLGDSGSDQNFGNREKEFASTPAPLPQKSKTSVLGVLAAVIALAVIGFAIWRFMPRGAGSDSSTNSDAAEFTGTPQIAILPFQSLTGHANDEGFNKSLTQGIWDALSKQSDVKVVPQSEVEKYLASGVADPVTAGRQLGAQLIVHGMAQRLAGHIVVKVQLVSTQDGSQLWSSGFEGTSDDVAGLAQKIAQKIVTGQQP